MDATEREQLAALAEGGLRIYVDDDGCVSKPIEQWADGSDRLPNHHNNWHQVFPAPLAALAEAEAEVERLGAMVEWLSEVIVDAREACQRAEQIQPMGSPDWVESGIAMRNTALHDVRMVLDRERTAHPSALDRVTDERDRYRRQVEAVRALHRSSQLGAICVECDAAWPCPTVRATEGADGDVPMSQDRGHDLRERITHDIDRAHAQAKYLLLDDGYREGYLDGLEAAERIARAES